MGRLHHALLACALLGAATATTGSAWAETADGAKMQFNFTEDGKSYVRLMTWHQIWARFSEMNPGTTVSDRALDQQLDVGIRRSRFLALGRVGKFLMVFHFGMNNQTFNNGKKPQLYVHDVWTQYDVAGEALSVGGGLHYWNGISRMSNWSTIKFLSLDAPVLNWPTIEKSDQFARQLGVFAKGKIGQLDYRFALNRPFNAGAAPGPNADYNPKNNSPAFAGYLMYQFWDQEGNLLPYLPGTYLGEKSVLNVGSGFYYHPNAMSSTTDTGAVQDHDQLALSGDIFVDLPLGDGVGALTAYAAYVYLDFGPNHLRNVGIMNVGAGGTSLNGPGNGFPVIGTGHHAYFQAGYLLPFDLMGTQVQPYVTTQVSSFEARDSIAVIPEVGFNWYLSGQNAKVSFLYRARPVFTLDGDMKRTVDTYKSEAILQTQLFY